MGTDALHGPMLMNPATGRIQRVIVFGLIDDRSQLMPYLEGGFGETEQRFLTVLYRSRIRMADDIDYHLWRNAAVQLLGDMGVFEHHVLAIVDFGPWNLSGHFENFRRHQGFLSRRYSAHTVRDSGAEPMPLVVAAEKSLSVRRK